MHHVDDLPALGRRIKRMREALSLSQRDLAFEGCSYAYLSRVEAGGRQPSEQVLGELARRLGTTVRYLKTGDPDPIELGLAEANLSLLELTEAERFSLEVALEEATFREARAVAWKVRKQRADAAAVALEAELDDIAAKSEAV